jgi:hypothetical protein
MSIYIAQSIMVKLNFLEHTDHGPMNEHISTNIINSLRNLPVSGADTKKIR